MKSVLAISIGTILVSIVPAKAMAMDAGTAAFSIADSAQVSTPWLESGLAFVAASGFANALAPYARAGWQAQLSTRAHNVSGTVTIVDADTFRVDNFFYDGGGINVHFILAASDNNTEPPRILRRLLRLRMEPS